MNTDTTDNLNTRGWIAFDDTCPFCRRAVATWGPLFRNRGFQFIPLRTHWVAKRLGIEPGQTPDEFKLLLPDGSHTGGSRACRKLARSVWWMAPFGVLAELPGLSHLAELAYRAVASRRQCLGDICAVLPAMPVRHHRATSFLESP